MKYGTRRRLGRGGALKKALFQFPRRQLDRGGALKKALFQFPHRFSVPLERQLDRFGALKTDFSSSSDGGR